MKRKITALLREYVFPLSIITTIFGGVIFILGLLGVLAGGFLEDVMGLPREFLPWTPYLLITGFFILITGIWYLYSYLKNKKFLLRELETNKRSEFIKKRLELHEAAKHLPSRYKDMLREKEVELRIR